MERFLFSKIEIWLVLLLAILAVVGAIGFGALVLKAERSRAPRGAAASAIVSLAEVPQTLVEMLQPDDTMVAKRIGKGVEGSGWSVDADAAKGLGGYLLLSHYDGDRRGSVVELRSLPDGTVRHEWRPDVTRLLDGVDWGPLAEPLKPQYFRMVHPYLFPNGDLLVKDHHSPLFRIDGCGRKIWQLDGRLFHHSTEPDGEGGFWIPSDERPSAIPGTAADFVDDSLAHVSADGKLLSATSLAQSMIDAGHFAMIFTAGDYNSDPLHLNDIQPVPGDGTYWKAGDLFLSLRHLSMLMLYRPSTRQILWMKQGPWLAQHDVDVLDDHRIEVFDNNAYDKGRGGYIDGTSDILVYDFATDEVSMPYHEAMSRNDVLTLTEGLFTVLPGGDLLVEPENSGRLLILTPDGDVAVQFANRAGDDKLYAMGWSWFVEQKAGDAALAALKGTTCDG